MRNIKKSLFEAYLNAPHISGLFSWDWKVGIHWFTLPRQSRTQSYTSFAQEWCGKSLMLWCGRLYADCNTDPKCPHETTVHCITRVKDSAVEFLCRIRQKRTQHRSILACMYTHCVVISALILRIVREGAQPPVHYNMPSKRPSVIRQQRVSETDCCVRFRFRNSLSVGTSQASHPRSSTALSQCISCMPLGAIKPHS